eukprot:Em0006g208a
MTGLDGECKGCMPAYNPLVMLMVVKIITDREVFQPPLHFKLRSLSFPDSVCPCCCSSAARLECKLVNPAPKLIQQLLHDVIVWCESWMRSIKAIEYDSHCCSTVKIQEMQLVSKVVHQMLSTTIENYMQIPTGGTVRSNLQKTRTILSGSSEDADLMLEDELRALITEKKEQLLHDAGITVNIPPMQGLAIKSMLSIP